MNQYQNLIARRICRTATVPFFIAVHLQKQIDFLAKIGMQVSIVSSDGPELKKMMTYSKWEYHTIDIHRTIHPLKDIVSLIKLYLLFRKNKYDIVHSTTPKAGLLSAIASFLARVPIRLHTWTGQPWVTLKGPIRTISRVADWLIGKLNSHCYADSDSQRRFLIAEGIVKNTKISVLGHGSLGGVDLERFNPNRWTISDKQKLRMEMSISKSSTVILFIGRMSADKGILELVHAFEMLLNSGYDIDLILVGPFDQDRGGKTTIKSKDILRNHRTHLVGYTDEPERYLAMADIFCLPSYREGFGNVVIEAAAMSIPTIGTEIVGLIDAIENGKSGWLIPPRDEVALTKALQRMLDDRPMAQKMGTYARCRCQQYFSVESVNHAQAAEYSRLLQKYQ